MKLQENNRKYISPSQLEGLILSQLGISADIQRNEGQLNIKILNYHSLFKLVKKLRKRYDFTVYHSKKNDHYIISIHEE